MPGQRRSLPSFVPAVNFSMPWARAGGTQQTAHGKGPFCRASVAVYRLPCAAYGKASAVGNGPFAVCIRHTTKNRNPIVLYVSAFNCLDCDWNIKLYELWLVLDFYETRLCQPYKWCIMDCCISLLKLLIYLVLKVCSSLSVGAFNCLDCN